MTTLADGAVISEDGTYRYALTRGDWLGGCGAVLFVMLNPSTADASVDDPTIRRCVGFARAWGFARLHVVNLYAYRATDPRELRGAADPVGPENDEWIRRLAEDSDEVVAAWGADKQASAPRVARVLSLVAPTPVSCLKLTKAGAPWHPLYVKADASRVAFPRMAA